MGGVSDDTTDGPAGEGRTDYPINEAGNGRGMDRIGEEDVGDPPITWGDRPGTPGGGQGIHTDQGGVRDPYRPGGGGRTGKRGMGVGNPET